ncbi:hypothetical protein V5F49_08040 [Xanthobacter sp. V3C-3]|uniref:hypothetical protein n=1 Tax=Xanthobacter lutulentifluminis TaxID=3119935 RepID=UPI003727B62B
MSAPDPRPAPRRPDAAGKADAPDATPGAASGTPRPRRLQPLNTSEIILIASVACLVAAAAIQAVVSLVLQLSAR